MKKLIVLLLALCMACGVWTIANAEDFVTPMGEYRLPTGVEVTKEIYQEHMLYANDDEIEWYKAWLKLEDASAHSVSSLELVVQIADFRTEEAMQRYADTWMNYDPDSQKRELPDGSYAACGKSMINNFETGLPVEFSAGYSCIAGTMAYRITVYTRDLQLPQEELDACFFHTIAIPFFLDVSIDEVVAEPTHISEPIEAQAPADQREVHLANATFQLDADPVTSTYNDNVFEGANEQYSLSLMCVDWDAEGIDISLTGDDQMDNAFWCSYLLFQDQDVASTIAAYSLPMDCDMPDGGDVMFMEVGEYLVLTHYYRNTGFLMLLDPVNDGDTEGLLLAGLEIAKSFRLDGVSEEEMQADAEELAAAEAEAAAQAAAEAAAQKYVVITAESGKIRTEASISGGLIKTAYKGETFELIREEGDWYVVDVNGRTGYIHQGVAAIQ